MCTIKMMFIYYYYYYCYYFASDKEQIFFTGLRLSKNNYDNIMIYWMVEFRARDSLSVLLRPYRESPGNWFFYITTSFCNAPNVRFYVCTRVWHSCVGP